MWGARILCVDEDRSGLRTLEQLLSGAGYEVTACEDVLLGLLALASVKPHLIVIRPECGAKHRPLLRYFKDMEPRLPVLFPTYAPVLPSQEQEFLDAVGARLSGGPSDGS